MMEIYGREKSALWKMEGMAEKKGWIIMGDGRKGRKENE